MILNYRTLDLPADYDRIFDPPRFHKRGSSIHRGRMMQAMADFFAPNTEHTGHKWKTHIGQAAVCETCHTRASGATIGTQCAGGER